MSFDIGIAMAAAAIVVMLLVRFIFNKSRYSGIEDAVLFVRQLSICDFEQVTDPAVEWSLRRSVSRKEFSRLQHQRMRLCAEYLGRLVHNCEVVQGWSYCDHSLSVATRRNPADEKTYLLWELARTATEVRLFAVLTRLKVGVWLLFRADLLPSFLAPRLDTIRTIAGFNIVAAYQNMIDLAKQVSQFYGPDWVEKIDAAL